MNSIRSVFVIMLFSSWASNTLAENRDIPSASGTIRFQGAIVASGCEMSLQTKTVKTSCYQNGRATMRTFCLETGRGQVLPDGHGRTSLRWLDAQHTLGIMTVSYN